MGVFVWNFFLSFDFPFWGSVVIVVVAAAVFKFVSLFVFIHER